MQTCSLSELNIKGKTTSIRTHLIGQDAVQELVQARAGVPAGEVGLLLLPLLQGHRRCGPPGPPVPQAAAAVLPGRDEGGLEGGQRHGVGQVRRRHRRGPASGRHVEKEASRECTLIFSVLGMI